VFTGIVREVGGVVSFEDGRLVVQTAIEARLGDSVSVDGVCLTVVNGDAGRLAFDVVPETLSRVKPFRVRVNLEPAVRAGEPLGGHYVQGHVDGIGRVREVDPEGDSVRVRIGASPSVHRYLIQKGSVAIDGVSLTVARLGDDEFEVALVPHTLEVTTLWGLAPDDEVNLEVDVLAKYVERFLGADEPGAGRATIRG
jgi:riboflavin synthase